MTDKKKVLILGATGLFGELLAKRMEREGRFEVIAAGRGREALEKLAAETGVTFRVLDRDDKAAVASVL